MGRGISSRGGGESGGVGIKGLREDTEVSMSLEECRGKEFKYLLCSES